MIGALVKSSSRIALVAAAGVAFGGVAAKAADLGGDCCADLEERVAELEATTARKGNRKMSLQVYGQVNRAILFHDQDGADIPEKFSVRDNDGRSGSRFGFRGKANITADLLAGYRIEIGIDNEDDNSGEVNYRHTMVYIQSKTYGTLKLGRTSSATDGIAEIALASAVTPFSCEEGDEAGLQCAAVGLDGSREHGIHYVSPAFAGFTVSASWFHDGAPNTHNDNGYDVALRYAGEFGAIRVAAGVGYRSVEDGVDADGADEDDTTRISGSASIMHVPSGVFLNTVLGVEEDEETDEEVFGYYISGGVKGKWVALGSTTLEVGFGGNDTDGVDANPYYIVAGVSQKIDAAAMDVYLNYQYQDNDLDGADSESTNIVTMGARVKF